MKSVAMGSTLNPSSLQSPSMETPVAYCHGKAQVSRIQMWKIITIGHSNSKLHSCKLNYTGLHLHQRRRTEVLAMDDSAVVHPQIPIKSVGEKLAVIYKYGRVYTLQGTLLSIISISLLAVEKLSDFSPSFFIGLIQAMIGGILANLFVVAINQLSDIEIDKVNKPYLPLPSGELSVKSGIRLTLLYAIMGFCLGWITKSWPLKLGLLLWYAVGIGYSVHLPLLRWKNNPALAAMSVWAMQGAIVPILFYLHSQTYIYGRSLLLSKHAIFVSGIMSVYAVVATLFKDIPDVEGDKMHGVNSLASQIGSKPVFWLCIGLLEMAYAIAIIIGLTSTRFWSRSIMVIGHIILGFILWREANLVDLKDNEAIESFYLFIWKLFGAEYLLVPFLRF